MRIALVALHFAEYAARLAVALSARHEVLLVLRAANARAELTEDLRGQLAGRVQLRCLEGHKWRDPRMACTSLILNRILRRFRPDVVHVQEVHPLLVALTVRTLRTRVPVVLTVHDPISHSGGLPTDSWLGRSLMWVRRQAPRLIVHGPRMRSELEQLDAQFHGRVHVIPHGVLGLPPRAVQIAPESGTFLFFGRVEPYKGLGYLLDACEMLHADGHAFRLVVAGTGTDLERHRARLAAAPYIELIDDYIPPVEVSALFQRAAAVVLPYRDATQSGVAAIAVANARPVIATATGDLPDIVIPGRTGLLVPPRDARALADAMAQLLADAKLRDTLTAGAGEFARQKLGWSRVAELSEQVYVRAASCPVALSCRSSEGVAR